MASTQAIKADVNVTAQSNTYVTNTVMQVLQRIAHKRNLDPGYIQQNYQVLENGIRTWLTEGKLKSIMLQVFQPGSSSATENWKTIFEYRAEPNAEVQKPPIQQIEEFCMRLAALPAGCTYQVFAEVSPDASHVEGWTPGTPLPIFGKSRKDFVRWGYGNIGAGLEYEGGEWTGQHRSDYGNDMPRRQP